jgi:cell division transport system ATP-binding protein
MSKTVFDNVALPLKISGFPIENIAKRVRAALNSVGLLDKISSNVAQLSGGELQRTGIARAVVHRPKLLFADEPTGNLDPELSKDIMELLVRFQNSGTSIILATHDSSLINRYSQRVILLENGYLVEDSRS